MRMGRFSPRSTEVVDELLEVDRVASPGPDGSDLDVPRLR